MVVGHHGHQPSRRRKQMAEVREDAEGPLLPGGSAMGGSAMGGSATGGTAVTRSAKERVAFIGLGIMGGPMAVNLLRAGHTVNGFNRSTEGTERLLSAGGAAAGSIAEAAASADVVITMLPDSPDVERVVEG